MPNNYLVAQKQPSPFTILKAGRQLEGFANGVDTLLDEMMKPEAGLPAIPEADLSVFGQRVHRTEWLAQNFRSLPSLASMLCGRMAEAAASFGTDQPRLLPATDSFNTSEANEQDPVSSCPRTSGALNELKQRLERDRNEFFTSNKNIADTAA